VTTIGMFKYGGGASALTGALAGDPSPNVRKKAAWALGEIGASASVAGATLNICFAYTATLELTQAISRVAGALADGRLLPEDVSPALFEQCLESHDLPSSDVDLLVRTSGEIRLSDFLLWQGSSACLLFWDVLWPAFTPLHLYASVFLYQQYADQVHQHRREDPGTPSVPVERLAYVSEGQQTRVEAFLSRLDENRCKADLRT